MHATYLGTFDRAGVVEYNYYSGDPGTVITKIQCVKSLVLVLRQNLALAPKCGAACT